jgi:hypothetical protein
MKKLEVDIHRPMVNPTVHNASAPGV